MFLCLGRAGRYPVSHRWARLAKMSLGLQVPEIVCSVLICRNLRKVIQEFLVLGLQIITHATQLVFSNLCAVMRIAL